MESAVGFRYAPPEGGTAVGTDALPFIDVSRLPGARIVTREGVTSPHVDVFVVCAQAPSDHFAKGLEDLVMSYATSFAKRALAAQKVEPLRVEPLTIDGDRCEQRVHGEGENRAELRHILGFVGDDREAALCTIACVSRAHGDDNACASIVDGAAVYGPFGPAPAPGIAAQIMVGAAENPALALAIALTLAALMGLLLIVKRPRPHW